MCTRTTLVPIGPQVPFEEYILRPIRKYKYAPGTFSQKLVIILNPIPDKQQNLRLYNTKVQYLILTLNANQQK